MFPAISGIFGPASTEFDLCWPPCRPSLMRIRPNFGGFNQLWPDLGQHRHLRRIGTAVVPEWDLSSAACITNRMSFVVRRGRACNRSGGTHEATWNEGH